MIQDIDSNCNCKVLLISTCDEKAKWPLSGIRNYPKLKLMEDIGHEFFDFKISKVIFIFIFGKADYNKKCRLLTSSCVG